MDTSRVVEALNAYVADLGVLDVKLHNLHWNIEGKDFFTLHAKLEEFYDQIGEEFDEVAERVLMLGARPLASLKEYIAAARVKELESVPVKSGAVIDILFADFTHLRDESVKIIGLSEEAGDYGTADQFTGYLRNYEKLLWMIRAMKS